jgi:predicted amino acid dehydrogenase
LLIGRREDALDELRDSLRVRACSELVVSTSMYALAGADLVLSVTSAVHDVIWPADLQSGSVVCDVARPVTFL